MRQHPDWILFILTTSLLTSQVSADRFWHISDLHYDPNLALRRSCVRPVTEIPEWGSEFCDNNLKLINSSLQALKRLEPNPQFIIWTGDTAFHYPGGTIGNEHEVIAVVERISRIVDSYFPNTKVIASLGNNDFVPDDQLPAKENRIYKSVGKVWRELGWFDGELSKSDAFQKYGYYVVQVKPGLVAMAMNTNLYYKVNKVYESQEIDDPGNQFEVLDSVLLGARARSDKVLITAHIPLGVDSGGRFLHLHQKYNEKFISLIQQYQDVLAGLFFGHEHYDSFKVISNTERKPVAVALLAPSVAPRRWDIAPGVSSPYHNPAVILIDYDKSANLITERTQYAFNLREANSGENPVWKENYKFTSLYNVPDVSTSSALKAAQLIAKEDKVIDYLRQFFGKQTIENFPCDR